LIEGLALSLAGLALLLAGLRSSRRHGLLTSTFWQSFARFASYRVKRLYGPLYALAGILLIGWGGSLVVRSILAFYAARLGRFGP
jgi:hypothetical protein